MASEEKLFFKSLLENTSLLKTLSLEGKYYERFCELLECEYLVKNTPSFVNSKFEKLGNPFLKLLMVFLGGLLSIILWPYYNFKIKYKDKHIYNLVFFPFAGHIVRYKDVYSITDRPLSIIYPPIFHYSKVINHIAYFNEIKKPIRLDCFNFGDLIKTFCKTLFSLKDLVCFESKINNHFGISEHKIVVLYFQFNLYSMYYLRLLNTLDKNDRFWFFDYDLDAKYIAFNFKLHMLRPKDSSIHMQHGIFHKAEIEFSNTVADYHLCCSNREKDIIEAGNNAHGAKVIVQGCPLQSLNVQSIDIVKKYKLLILLTSTDLEEIFILQTKVLKLFYYMEAQVLVRFRPASYNIDREKLKNYLSQYNVSNGTSLEEDVKSANCVISFSEDSIFSCFRNSAKLILFVSDQMYEIYETINDNSPNMKVYSSSHLDEDMLRVFADSNDACDFYHDASVIENFGIFDLKSYRKRFERNLTLIKNANN